MERDRAPLVQHNMLAMHERAAEAAGNIDVLLPDKTGTITLGSRQATVFIPAEGVDIWHGAEVAQLASLADETLRKPQHCRAGQAVWTPSPHEGSWESPGSMC